MLAQFLPSYSVQQEGKELPALGEVGEEVEAPLPLDLDIFFFSTFLTWVLPVPAKSCFLLCQGNVPGPEGVAFVQLVAMSQCTETDVGGLATWLPQSTQPELCPILGFPLRAVLPQRMASLSHKSF